MLGLQELQGVRNFKAILVHASFFYVSYNYEALVFELPILLYHSSISPSEISWHTRLLGHGCKNNQQRDFSVNLMSYQEVSVKYIGNNILYYTVLQKPLIHPKESLKGKAKIMVSTLGLYTFLLRVT